MNLRFAATSIALAVLTAAQTMAAKPIPPPPSPAPPPPPGSCSGAPGVFPAFAYTKSRTHITKRGNRTFDGTDLYIANSTGSCSVLLSTERWDIPLSYRQIGNEARIAWRQGSEIRLLKLPISNGNVVPILPTTIYSNSTTAPYSINSVELSADGQTIYFTDEHSPAEKLWQSTVKAIDLTSCTANCTPQTLYTFPNDNGVAGLSINAADDRLYMSIHDRVPDIRTISFLQKQPGLWSPLQHVVSNRDLGYSDITGFGSTALGRWDYQGSGAIKDVLAIAVERSSGVAFDVMDVSDCVVSAIQSCYGSGDATVVRSGIVGDEASFTSQPASSDPPPNLLVSTGNWRDNNESVREVDLDSMAVTPPLVAGARPDSSD